ncbi:TPA: tyrosine-type recombinase/integrase [Vibrio parahaemolyticus]
MRNLHISKNGIWQFRFQIPRLHRHLFSGRYEIKRSLKTSDKQEAVIKALALELEIRTSIQQQKGITEDSKTVPATPATTTNMTPREFSSPTNPFKCLDKYRDAKKDLVHEKTLNMTYAKCHIVLSLLKVKSIRDIRRVQAEDVRKLLSQYPINAKKHKLLSKLSGIDVIEANKKLQLAPLSPESIKDYIQKCSSFFEWCLQMELTDINPFKGMKFKKTRRDSEAKHAYNKADLQKLFSTEIHTKKQYKHPHYYWLPLLGVFTGARLNELCQLYKSDIYQEDGIWVISINDSRSGQRLKNNFSRRLIPLHPKLVELGFIDYLTSVNHERLFPALKLERDGYGTAASKWFGRLKTRLGFGKGYDFHSLRHTVATQFKNNDVSPIVAGEILGHAQNNITYDRYGKSINLNKLLKAINVLQAELPTYE